MRQALVSMTLVAALVMASSAHAQSWAPRFVGEFTTSAAGAPTGFHEEIDYFDAARPEEKPYAVERIVVELPEGAVIDTSVPEQCKASQPQLMLLGEAACPAGSRIGGGEVDIDTGSGAPGLPRIVESRVTLFNDQDAIILLTETTNTGAAVRSAGRVSASDGRFVNDAPALPGFPPPEPASSIRRVRLDIDNVTTVRDGIERAYLTTPPTCPHKRRSWTTTGVFTFRDGGVHSVDSGSPCDRPRGVARAAQRRPAAWSSASRG